MRILLVLPFVALAFLCWGNYGPLMHQGQHGMAGSSLRPFVGVGLAYFLIAVLIPLFVLSTRGEQGKWTARGAFWSLLAGTVGAFGALGIIMAFKFYGRPVYVMPLVFGLAPVVNTLVTMTMSRTLKEASPIFIAGVIVVALGAAGVMYFKPERAATTHAHEPTIVENSDGSLIIMVKGKEPWVAKSEAQLESDPKLRPALEVFRRARGPSPNDALIVMASIALTAICWGSYGPVLHKGQMKMAGSRLRPFLCVGLAYFGIAVIVPLLVLQVWHEAGSWMPDGKPTGLLWSLAAGATGALGALGIIMAFNFGGKPIFVMPLVFGCAPVVNTFTTLAAAGTFRLITPPFLASLAMVIVGAVTVLVFAPKSHPPGAGGGHGPPSDASAELAAQPQLEPADREAKRALLGEGP